MWVRALDVYFVRIRVDDRARFERSRGKCFVWCMNTRENGSNLLRNARGILNVVHG